MALCSKPCMFSQSRKQAQKAQTGERTQSLPLRAVQTVSVPRGLRSGTEGDRPFRWFPGEDPGGAADPALSSTAVPAGTQRASCCAPPAPALAPRLLPPCPPPLLRGRPPHPASSVPSALGQRTLSSARVRPAGACWDRLAFSGSRHVDLLISNEGPY